VILVWKKNYNMYVYLGFFFFFVFFLVGHHKKINIYREVGMHTRKKERHEIRKWGGGGANDV